ncbi:hypothetical protein V3C99_010237 [Haemonchus contortus]
MEIMTRNFLIGSTLDSRMKTSLSLVLIAVAVLCQGEFPFGEKCHRSLPQPDFLRNIGWRALLDYYSIIYNYNEVIDKQNDDVKLWAQKYGVEKQIEEYGKEMEGYMEELKRNVTTLIAELPTALEKFLRITQERNQTQLEMWDALKGMRSQEFEVFDVLRASFKAFRPRNCPNSGISGFLDSFASKDLGNNWMNGWDDDLDTEDLMPFKGWKQMQLNAIHP